MFQSNKVKCVPLKSKQKVTFSDRIQNNWKADKSNFNGGEYLILKQRAAFLLNVKLDLKPLRSLWIMDTPWPSGSALYTQKTTKAHGIFFVCALYFFGQSHTHVTWSEIQTDCGFLSSQIVRLLRPFRSTNSFRWWLGRVCPREVHGQGDKTERILSVRRQTNWGCVARRGEIYQVVLLCSGGWACTRALLKGRPKISSAPVEL